MSCGLDHFRLLGHSGLRVSPLCLGTMTFGTEWGWGTEKEDCLKILNAYADKGGNFIDTANFYTGGTSEIYLGEFLKGRREHFVLATKYTSNMQMDDPNAGGNQRKNMMQSLEASLKRLQTDYIDLYWVHAWDYRTPIEEVMRGLDDLVRQGKILYIGVSDFPAWKIAEANTLAQMSGWTSFIALQIHYNLIERSVERELIPMAQEFNIGVMPWSPLAGGLLAGKYSQEDFQKPASESEQGTRWDFARALGMLSERSMKIVEKLKKVAKEIGKSPGQTALNWLLENPDVTCPIIGARTMSQLEDNLGSLDFSLSEDQIRCLDDVSHIEMGFPHDFLNSDRIKMVVDGTTKVEGRPF